MAIIEIPPPNTPVIDKNGLMNQRWYQWFASARRNATSTDDTLTEVDGSLTAITGQVTALDGRTDTLETDVTALEADVAGIETDLAGKQPLDATLTAFAGLTTAPDQVAYSTGVDAFAMTSLTTHGRSIIDDADPAATRTTLGLGTMATQAASGVAITGGTVTGITDLAVADGGTGASDASGARTNLGTVNDPGSNGLLARTAANTTTARSFDDATSQIVWTNPAGTAGNPKAALAPTIIHGDGTNPSVISQLGDGAVQHIITRASSAATTSAPSQTQQRYGGSLSALSDVLVNYILAAWNGNGQAGGAMRNGGVMRFRCIAATPSTPDIQTRWELILAAAGATSAATTAMTVDTTAGAVFSVPISFSRQNVALTADNQSITVAAAYVSLTSDDATATNRTFVLANGSQDGQIVIFQAPPSNACELAASSNCKLSGGTTWSPNVYDTLTLMWSAQRAAWLEIARAANS